MAWRVKAGERDQRLYIHRERICIDGSGDRPGAVCKVGTEGKEGERETDSDRYE